MTEEAKAASTKIGILIGSLRSPRAGRQISEWVLNILKDCNKNSSIAISLIDLNDWNLPLIDEPGIPSKIQSPDDYVHDHTKRWSREIASFSAFIFVTPQYNWGYPAGLKNALDYLYNEWKGKPAAIISYGGHGGGKAAAQLRQVLMGLRMRPAEKMVALTFPSKEFLENAAKGRIDLKGDDAVWTKEKTEIVEEFEELIGLLNTAENK